MNSKNSLLDKDSVYFTYYDITHRCTLYLKTNTKDLYICIFHIPITQGFIFTNFYKVLQILVLKIFSEATIFIEWFYWNYEFLLLECNDCSFKIISFYKIRSSVKIYVFYQSKNNILMQNYINLLKPFPHNISFILVNFIRIQV